MQSKKKPRTNIYKLYVKVKSTRLKGWPYDLAKSGQTLNQLFPSNLLIDCFFFKYDVYEVLQDVL